MRQYLRYILLIICSLTSLLTAAEGNSPIPAFTAEYRLSMGNMVAGKVKISLSMKPDGSYHYRQHSIPVGLLAAFKSDEITEESRGKIVGHRVIPESYLYRRDKSDKPRHRKILFDWKSDRVTDQKTGAQWKLELPKNSQDKFSKQLAMMLAMQKSRQDITFQVASKERIREYHFRPQGEDSIKLKKGQINALKVTRSKDKRPANATLWLDPEMHYIPVRVEKQEHDNLFTMELISIEFTPQMATAN